jgi:hypothetical protein
MAWESIAISNRNETLSWFLDVPYLAYTSSVGGAEQTRVRTSVANLIEIAILTVVAELLAKTPVA